MDDPSARQTPESWPTTLDRVLRGSYLDEQALANGRLDIPVRRLLVLGVALGAIYGICLGTFRMFRGGDHATQQMLASALKVPSLFMLTLLVTFPSLYVFTALQRLPLQCGAMLRLLLLSNLVHLGVIASLGPVFAFFAASTPSYSFLLLLDVAFFAIGGLIGCAMLQRAARNAEASVPQTRRLLGVWCCVYAIVGAQMGWLLRPFVGNPQIPFAWLRPTEGNVLVGLMDTIGALFR
ncbi:MAG: hypothetical protein H6838_03250 [Planctomycetes bacterium]|nr:hypothetical protein [Planctomycetota bacterium]MCB9884479.1 hypothetical protein [Planctomycetota bacterium]